LSWLETGALFENDAILHTGNLGVNRGYAFRRLRGNDRQA
jgi:hypothetical protein